jgi:hypothetical protein
MYHAHLEMLALQWSFQQKCILHPTCLEMLSIQCFPAERQADDTTMLPLHVSTYVRVLTLLLLGLEK